MLRADLKDIYFYTVSNKYEAQLAMLEPIYCLTLSLSIGIPDDISSDYFLVHVVNLNWVRYWVEKDKALLGEKTIIVDFDDFDDLEKELKFLVNSIEGETWEDILSKLRKYFDWEYENHKFVEC
ncbi:immunity protein 8 of polymorphic toxin system [Cricetibacter osteomyelitidis]|uniref:Immunity protein 8 of polymorphic toxin system n=1 Tax=Cricetibacter osteomyelitidis TaxID=1521931 RepID=A0A4R2SSA8_9PAST|nr:Imm8 family immunity protein [Cricetibacter osteomyelitidis]TCP92055.1 immunity protein 8 of polymorphic toxin system [Cricetibacter osteomyelitidis]